MKIASVKIGFIITTVFCLSLSVVLWTQSAQLNLTQSIDNIDEMGELFAGELINFSLEQLMSIDIAQI